MVVFTPDEQDGRLAAARQALTFWNQTLWNLDLQLRFLDPEVVVSSPVARALETYARRLSQDGWRLHPGAPGLDPPSTLTRLAGDIIVLLSTQPRPILSFAWPIAEPTRYFLAIQTDHVSPLKRPGVSRHVIAHEIGHTLGLTHNRNPTTLMCGPSCAESAAFRPEDSAFLPLTPEDRARLLELHPRRLP